jgi:6-phosphogluconolactonase (cycloisomerase 2 family)
VDSTGVNAYVANNTNGGLGTVSQFKIGASGALTPMGTPTAATGNGPVWITLDSVAQFAYVVNSNANTISQYAVGADGSLVPLSMATVPTGVKPFALAIVY